MHSLPPLAAVTLPFLDEMVALFTVSVLIAYISHRLKLVPIAGFLLAGVLIGPGALGLVRDQELVNSTAEIGVILLLFTIGVEFSLEKLARIKRFIFAGGGMQTGLTTALVTGLLLIFGVTWQEGLFTGFLVALSSTAIVLGLLASRSEEGTTSGQMALAVLIFQDLAVVGMVLMVPILGGQGGTPAGVLWVLAKAVGVVVAVVVLARKGVPWLLEKIARTRRQELFLLTVMAICFGTAWVTSLAGVSLALGAFLAGLMVSESHYSENALSEILPLRTIFNAVFFVSIGMLLDVGFLVNNLPLVLGAAVGVLLLKTAITAGSVMALGLPVRIAAATALTLAQIGEFSFVLEVAGRPFGLTPAGLGVAGQQTFIAVTVLLMLLTPFLMHLGPKLGWALAETRLGRTHEDPDALPATEEEMPLEDHVIVVGSGPAGQHLVRVLRNTDIPFVLIDLDPVKVEAARADDVPVLYGDASRPHILEKAAVHRAKLCAVVINDAAAIERVIGVARFENPTLQIIARTRFIGDIERLQQAGADVVVPEELETSVRIFSQVLGAYMIPPEEIERQVRTLRADDYRVLRGSIQEAHLMVLQGLDEDGLHTRAIAVRPGAPAAGCTLAELALRQKHGLTVLAVRRGSRTHGNPAGDFRLEPGDRLVLIGLATQFAHCADLFREPRPAPQDIEDA